MRWLNLGDAAVDGDRTPSAQSVRSESLERVLLADDNPDMREYASRLLRERYQVTAVCNGADALQSALAEPPDLILSDVMMPELDGFGLLRELRAHPQTRTVPVVLVSARAGEESRVEGLSAGADDYLIKPFTARELLARVAAHLSMNRRRREAEQALKESQATLQGFYDSSPFLMGVADLADGELIPVYGNRAAAEFLEIDGTRLPGAPLHSLGVQAQLQDRLISKCRESRELGGSLQFEFEHLTRAGARWLSANLNYLGIGPAGHPRFSFICEDITGRKQQDELLRKSNEELRRANADLEQFAYSASHDLQEPLRQVAIYSQLLQRRYAGSLDGKAAEYLGYCVEGAQRMESLIRDLLAYSQAARTSDSPTERVDLNEVVEAAKKNLETTIRETGAVIASTPLPSIRADRVPISHVMQNLLSNALKYRSAAPPLVEISAEPGEGFWRLAIRDNGIGIPQRFHEQIFGIFKRLHDRNEYPGTGVGLAICQKVIERYGGRIWVESEEGSGSTFFFTLPDTQTNEN
jgi:signal transduction histidine kinase